MSDEFHILLIEDSPPDVLILRRAMAAAAFPHRLTTLGDGASALAHIDRLSEPASPTEQVPDLVLLDLNLPGPDGGQILSRLKADPRLRVIPVVVLSTSGRVEDVWRSYLAGANTFIQKPADFDGYRELVASLFRYWARNATLPPRRPPGS